MGEAIVGDLAGGRVFLSGGDVTVLPFTASGNPVASVASSRRVILLALRSTLPSATKTASASFMLASYLSSVSCW